MGITISLAYADWIIENKTLNEHRIMLPSISLNLLSCHNVYSNQL